MRSVMCVVGGWIAWVDTRAPFLARAFYPGWRSEIIMALTKTIRWRNLTFQR